jgi:hypothetical protein
MVLVKINRYLFYFFKIKNIFKKFAGIWVWFGE